MSAADLRTCTVKIQFEDTCLCVRSKNEPLCGHLRHLYGAFAPPRRDVRPTIELVVRSVGEGWELDKGGQAVFRTQSWDELLSHVEWTINTTAVESLRRFYQIHASAVSKEGRAIICPASPGSGKTTFCFWMVLRGYRYLSDEIVLLDPDTRQLAPFPKSLSIKEGTYSLMRSLRPELDLDRFRGAFLGTPIWYVPPSALGSGVVSPVSTPSVFLFVRYDPSRRSALEPIGKGEAVLRTVRESFNFLQHREGAIEALTEIIDRCPCHELIVNDLSEAEKLAAKALAETT